MRALKTVVGVPNLNAIAATASSARVLNLHAVEREHGHDPVHRARPMFLHPILNRSIIVKHNLRADEKDRLAPRRFGATKVIFPFDANDLNLGGQFLYVDQPNFIGAMVRNLDYAEFDMDRDLMVLRVLDRLPTFDPFLVREILNQKGIKVAQCYYRLSERDKSEMLGFVGREIQTLIDLCFGGHEVGDARTARLSELLLADEGGAELEPLRLTLRMDDADFSDAMFAWKAFLYYRWRSRALSPRLRATRRSIARIDARRYGGDVLAFSRSARSSLEDIIALAWTDVGQTLKLYDNAFKSLTQQRSPEHFRAFLVRGSRLFQSLGERIGRLEQVVSFWNHRLEGDQQRSPEEELDALRDLLHGLSAAPVSTVMEGVRLAAVTSRPVRRRMTG